MIDIRLSVLRCHSEEQSDEESKQILHFVQNDTRFTEYLRIIVNVK